MLIQPKNSQTRHTYLVPDKFKVDCRSYPHKFIRRSPPVNTQLHLSHSPDSGASPLLFPKLNLFGKPGEKHPKKVFI